MADADTGMDKRDLKKLLVLAKKGPLNCALAQGDSQSGGLGLILVDRIRPSKSLLADLIKQFPTARNACFGTAAVDPEDATMAVTFTVNKLRSGMDKKLRKTLRGTGFRNVVIQTAG